MSCGIHTGCKMFMSIHQCMRNTLNTHKDILICRRYNTLRKALRPVSLVRFSQFSVRDTTIRNDQGGSYVFSKKHQLVPLACNLYSTDRKPKVEEKKESIYKRFKAMMKDYWYVLVPVHVLTSCCWFGFFYYLAVSGVDIPAVLENLGAPESWIDRLKNSKTGNFVLAYTLYKVMTPIRYTVTIGGTSLSVRHLRKWGWIKPAPTAAEFKDLVKEQKEALRDLKADCQDKMQVTKNEFLKTKDKMKKELEVAKEEFHKSMSEMRRDFKDGVKGGAEEWKIISKSVLREPKLTAKLKEKENN